MRVPEWSPDSSRIAFAAFDQTTGHISILEAGFKDKNAEPEVAATAEREAESKGPTDADATPTTDAAGKENTEPSFTIENARVVYQFLHHGGPNTPGMVAPMYLPDSRRMVFIAELSGFRHLHMLDPRYEALSQVTHGNYEVYPFHLAHDHSTLFVTATRDDPNQEQVFAIDLESGQMRQLTHTPGVFGSVASRDDGSYVLARHADFGKPAELFAITPDPDAAPHAITDSHPTEAHKLTTVSPEYFTYENRHGQTIHGHMFKPADWTPQDKRPLLIYVYGGPLGERKMATRGDYAAPSYFFARYMTEVHGWVTATIDPRGASGYGAVFEKANFEQVGKPQTEDLVDGARWFVKHHGVDEKKLAMHGWSFGGFQTQMTMYTEPDVFAVGIAGAGPTEWHNYNSWYSTGTIGANQPGKTDLEKFSLLPIAKNLKGKLLLVHGVEDSNVLYQDTVRVYRELLKANKEVLVELFLDPTGGHGLGGDVKTIGRYRKYEDFLLRHLGKGAPAPTPENDAPTE
jgi:dipeptidyl aminopeptidase/acylaminoacyl peptidase